MTEVRAEDLVGMHEVCQILGLTDARVGQLRRDDSMFPAPVRIVKATPLWLAPDLVKWREGRVKGKSGRPRRKVD